MVIGPLLAFASALTLNVAGHDDPAGIDEGRNTVF